MRGQNKLLTLLLIISLTILTAIFAVNTVSCRDPPTPPIYSNIPIPPPPESFSVTYVDHSYDVPTTTTYTTDYYTGKVTSGINPGYHVKNYTIEIKIKNLNIHQFPAEIDGNKSILEYAVQCTGSYAPDFKDDGGYSHYRAETGEYTTIVQDANSITPGGKIDVRVATIFGYEYMGADGIIPMMMEATKLSSWTPTQSLTIPSITTPHEESNQPIPTTPEFPATTIIPIIIASLVLVAVIQKRKQHNTDTK
jgi:hypothetical protein